MIVRNGLGQDSHRFLPEGSTKPCVIAGCTFEEVPGFLANSDGDVVYHAICNAISSLTGVLILGGIADDLMLERWDHRQRSLPGSSDAASWPPSSHSRRCVDRREETYLQAASA